jgi:hypothetical protein
VTPRAKQHGLLSGSKPTAPTYGRTAPDPAVHRAGEQHRALVGVDRGRHLRRSRVPDLLAVEVRKFFRRLR